MNAPWRFFGEIILRAAAMVLGFVAINLLRSGDCGISRAIWGMLGGGLLANAVASACLYRPLRPIIGRMILVECLSSIVFLLCFLLTIAGLDMHLGLAAMLAGLFLTAALLTLLHQVMLKRR